MLYVFEGLDGSGKSTLIRKVKKELEERGWKVKTIREPDKEYRDKLLASHNRVSIEDENAIFEECHNVLMEEKVKPAIQKGYVILSDRSYLYSSLAYQTETPEEFYSRREYYTSNFELPQRVFILNTDPELCRARTFLPREEEQSSFDKDNMDTYYARYRRYVAMSDFEEVIYVGGSDEDVINICDLIARSEEQG